MSETCECEGEGYFNSGLPGVIAHVEPDGTLDPCAKAERCDLCQRYASDAAARAALLEFLAGRQPAGGCPRLAGETEDGCQHQAHEDCMPCACCGRCREDLDTEDLCSDCGGKDENAEGSAMPSHDGEYLIDKGDGTDPVRVTYQNGWFIKPFGDHDLPWHCVLEQFPNARWSGLDVGPAEIVHPLAAGLEKLADQLAAQDAVEDQASAVRVEDKAVRTGVHQVVCISAPHWYARPDFLAWLNSAQPARADGTVIATWHHPGHPPTDCSDVFTLYDHGEGSDAPDGAGGGMPQPIWDEICRICQTREIEAAIVWIQNC